MKNCVADSNSLAERIVYDRIITFRQIKRRPGNVSDRADIQALVQTIKADFEVFGFRCSEFDSWMR